MMWVCPRRQTFHLSGELGLRWQRPSALTTTLAGGLAWKSWLQDGEVVRHALLPQVTGQLGWQLGRGSVLSYQPWLGTTATLRRVSTAIDGEPMDALSPFTGLLGLAVERTGRRQ